MANVRRVIVRVLIVAVLFAIAAGTGLVVYSIHISLQAEKTLHANHLVLTALREYVEQHEGRWPKSWDDLRGMRADGVGMWKWPDDIDAIRERVQVDFSVSSEDVAKMSPSDFTAVRQIGPHYEQSSEPAVQDLLNAIRRMKRKK